MPRYIDKSFCDEVMLRSTYSVSTSASLDTALDQDVSTTGGGYDTGVLLQMCVQEKEGGCGRENGGADVEGMRKKREET